MNFSKYNVSINGAEKILKSAGLLLERNWHPNYNGLNASLMRGMNYYEQWSRCLESRWHHYLLNDKAFFQFRIDPYPSFSYYDCPLEALGFVDFSTEIMGDDWKNMKWSCIRNMSNM